MRSRHMFPRTAGDAFRDASYANPFHRPTKRRAVGKWLAFSVFALLCLTLISAR